MKYLSQFQKFDIVAFLTGKQLEVVGCREWKDFDTGKHCGTVVEVAITQDKTEYRLKDGETGSNRFEKIALKVSKDITVRSGSIVVPIDAIATIYGQYRNQLSVKCSDIKAASNSTNSNTPQSSAASNSSSARN